MWELSSSFSGFYLGWHAALAVYALTIHGDIEQAAVFASAAGLHDSGPVTAENEPDRSCLVWLIYAQDRLDEALDLADRLRAVHTELGRVRRQVEMWCLRALVLWRWRQEPQAFAALECALTIAMRYRLLYALLNKPRLLQEILRAYAAQSQSAVTASFARQVLAMAEGDAAPIADQESAPLLVEPISGRELEVLQLLAQGLTHRQIADQLVVAPGTIKRHLSNIYSKLGVHSRTQALARTRDLYLL
jgi:LuxR family maltose regulon positive regulatory protein